MQRSIIAECDRYEIERFFRGEFQRLLAREEHPENLRLRRVLVDYHIGTDSLCVDLDFENDRAARILFQHTIPAGMIEGGDLYSIYWRTYEEFLVERDLRGARERLDEVVMRTTDVHTIMYAQQCYQREAEEIRRRHQRVPEYVTWVDYGYRTFRPLLWGDWDGPSAPSEAQKRGEELLEANLTKAQWRSYKSEGFFYVRGRQTKRMYRIRTGTSVNIDELKRNGSVKRRWCFAPEGFLCAADVMLAQKIAFENFEKEALKVANKFPPLGDLSAWY